MKITLTECDGCFAFECSAESVADAALLVRMGINATKEVRSCSTYAMTTGAITSGVVLGKRKNGSGQVPKAK